MILACQSFALNGRHSVEKIIISCIYRGVSRNWLAKKVYAVCLNTKFKDQKKFNGRIIFHLTFSSTFALINASFA